MGARTERSACGVGFVASIDRTPGHDIVQQGLTGLCRVEHRGGCLADRRTGDGAGLMTEIPFDLLGISPGQWAVGTVFTYLPPSEENRAFDIWAQAFSARGLDLGERRAVPVDTSVLGRQARERMPRIHQVFVPRPRFCRTMASFETLLYQAQQSARTALRRGGLENAIFVVSLSPKTIVYKALTRSQDLQGFFPDLSDPRFVTRFALFHRRFSTNTRTSWDRVQPFRLVAHNGEINTIAANRAWAFSREQALGIPSEELMTRTGISDSGSLNEMAEALRYRSSIPYLSEILAIMVPPAAAQSNAFYKFWSRAVEPWDGPAFLAFSDGDVVGARLDRNGFRPGRWSRTRDRFFLASEAGLFDVDPKDIEAKGALHGGSGVHVHLGRGEVHFSDPSDSKVNFNASFDARLERLGRADIRYDRDLLENTNLFRLGKEELNDVIVPMILDGKEPIGSMGDTARAAAMSDQPRSFFDYFFQNFAQVTNPPLDHLRERLVTDLTCYVGHRPNVFAPKTLIPLAPGLELTSPILDPEQIWALRDLGATSPNERSFDSVEVDITFARVKGPRGLGLALEEVSDRVLSAIEGGCSVIILTDRRAKHSRPPIPSLLALQAASRALDDCGRRLDASIVVETGDARTTHHIAALISFGAAAVCPYLTFETARRGAHSKLAKADREAAASNLHRAYDEGLLKIMSKMGISTVQGYQNAKLHTPLGLSQDFLDAFFPGFESVIGGHDLEHVAEMVLSQTERDRTHAPDELVDIYRLREHRKGAQGEVHGMTAELSKLVHAFTAEPTGALDAWADYQAYVERSRHRGPSHLRDLWRLPDAEVPAPIEDVQPRSEITRLFGTGAMSFGAISAESQRDLIKGMRAVGGRSASGEGGENPYYAVDGTTATVKQVASGRFGVTAEYLMVGEEIEIKIAQGAKPGEGGQLMGIKVDEAIARARHSSVGVDLISPPPLHDIYSIEDLRQLIYELKQLKPGVPVTVKLVAGAHIGTIAAGVVKAGADIVQISGGDGGTGAAAISSMHHAGLPWEIGLAEVHRSLMDEGLREHCILRVDGGLRHGEDLVKAACLGAEQFGFGKLVLIAQGCIMARVCQKNTCPRGIATHDPKFKAKYRGSPEAVAALMSYLAEDVRRTLSRMGFTRIEDIVGRGDLLVRDPIRHPEFDLGRLEASRPHAGFKGPALDERVNRLNQRLLEDAAPVLKGESSVRVSHAIRSTDRAVMATVSGALALARRDQPDIRGLEFEAVFDGSAGQGFCAFQTEGTRVVLRGEANDSVAKSMSGGALVIRPPEGAGFDPSVTTIIGNGGLYGATGGRVFIDGLAGDRFAVRNSGAVAVVQGVGLHAAEYMTGGTVVVLGSVSFNVGAGMTGGELYLPASAQMMTNGEYVVARPLDPIHEAALRALIEEHLERTGSLSAQRLLERGLDDFRRFIPRALAESAEAHARA